MLGGVLHICPPAYLVAALYLQPLSTASGMPRLANRYSPALAMLGDGRLHVFGGLLPDRSTPAREHWSLGISAGATGAACFRKLSTAMCWPLHFCVPSRITPPACLLADGSTDSAWAVEQPLPMYLGGSHGTVVELQPRGAGKRGKWH